MPVSKPSITYWNRLEPRPRSPSIKRGLAAQVRDPLWMLGRQWQAGEFQGEDAGSPAFAIVADTRSPMQAWRARGGPPVSLASSGPLENAIGAEPRAPDQALRVELGQVLEDLIFQDFGWDMVEELRSAYTLPPVDETDLAAMPDQNAARFLRVCGGRLTDGFKVYMELKDKLEAVQDVALRDTLAQFIDWVGEVCGPLSEDSAAGPAAWLRDRLEYDAEVVATLPDGKQGILNAQPTTEGGFGWYGFDLRPGASAAAGIPPGTAAPTTRRMLPANVWFRGMPKARWWEFEEGTTDFGEIKADKRDLARLVLMEFMLVHSPDWFLLPIELAAGSLCRIDALVVVDVFGTLTSVERAGQQPKDNWTMFSTSVEGATDKPADFFLLPLTAAAALQPGPKVEEVQFLRDEMANMVWAIEHQTQDGTGQPWLGHERALTSNEPAESTITNPQEQPTLAYRIQSEVPVHWIPFVPVLINANTGDVALERAALYRSQPEGPGTEVEPQGRLLRPATSPYRIREEEVPRSGLRVQRKVYRTRWIDGSTHTWVTRQKMVGRGEGSSGQRFDRAEPTKVGEP